MGNYREAFDRSIQDRARFWEEQARLVEWSSHPTLVLDDSSAPLFRWFVGGRLNTCHNALDRHVLAGRGDVTALIYDSPLAGVKARISYAELLERVERFAGALLAQGVRRGDRVVIYLPMIPEVVVAMLACARIGAVHSVVFGGFAAQELAVRIDDTRPAVLITASCGIEPNRVVEYKPIVDAALEITEHPPTRVVVLQRPQVEATLVDGRDVLWEDAIAAAGTDPVPCVDVDATDPLYVLYTSGTTGKPKGIVRDHGGHAVAMAWSMRNVYAMEPDDVWWAASDVGWVVGHSYIVYGPLIAGLTTVIYEGKPVGTPDAGAFWRVVEEYGVNGLFTAPTAMRAIRRADPDSTFLAQHDISSLRTLFQAGERLDPGTYEWASEILGIPVVDNWWQTETGWPIVANLRGLEPMRLKSGSPSVPVPGFDVQVLDPSGNQVGVGEEGAICIKLPLPPGALPTLWEDDERYVASYLSDYPGYYMSGDSGFRDEDGYLFVMGRTDDVINVAGHRLSTGAMEAVIARHPDVAECAVVGAADDLKGQLPRGFVVLKAGVDTPRDDLAAELVQRVRDEIGAVAAFRTVDVVDALPKTRSGKILRKSMRDIVDGKVVATPPTIEDPTVLERIRSDFAPR